jgi:hypothetical protein
MTLGVPKGIKMSGREKRNGHRYLTTKPICRAPKKSL